jgi:hypothetical protein
MVEGDLHTDARVQEVHLPLAQVVLIACEEARLWRPSVPVEALAEQAIQS